MTDLRRFRPLAYAIARDYFLPGADEDDVRQEAMIGVWKALRDYREGEGMSLRSFVALCVRRQLGTAVKIANQQNRRALNEAVRADAPVAGEEDELTLLDLLPAVGTDPVEILAAREEALRILRVVRDDLTPLERRALIGFTNGRTMLELAEEIGGNILFPDGRPRPKRVENAIVRARRKLADPTEAAQAA